MLHIVLFEPQIAPNTGNIIRLVANNGFYLHLIEPLGFDFEEKKLRRAGLDYHDLARVKRYRNFASFQNEIMLQTEGPVPKQLYAITTKGTQYYTDVEFNEGDILLFGSETSGLPPMLMESINPENRLLIPMQENSRSLNLSNAVSIVSYEAWRQLGFNQNVKTS